MLLTNFGGKIEEMDKAESQLTLSIEHYNDKWPFWLSPMQAIIIPINEKHLEYAEKIHQKLCNEFNDFETATKLSNNKFFVDLDLRNETVGLRVKEAIGESCNYTILVGDKEIELQDYTS